MPGEIECAAGHPGQRRAHLAGHAEDDHITVEAREGVDDVPRLACSADGRDARRSRIASGTWAESSMVISPPIVRGFQPFSGPALAHSPREIFMNRGAAAHPGQGACHRPVPTIAANAMSGHVVDGNIHRDGFRRIPSPRVGEQAGRRPVRSRCTARSATRFEPGRASRNPPILLDSIATRSESGCSSTSRRIRRPRSVPDTWRSSSVTPSSIFELGGARQVWHSIRRRNNAQVSRQCRLGHEIERLVERAAQRRRIEADGRLRHENPDNRERAS